MDFGPEMSLFAMFLGLLIGAGIGYGVGRSRGAGGGAAMRQRAEAHDALQREVTTHLHETARLMDKLAGDYRQVYDHLSESAQRMGVQDVPAPRQALTHERQPHEPGPHGAAPRERVEDDPSRRDVPVPPHAGAGG